MTDMFESALKLEEAKGWKWIWMGFRALFLLAWLFLLMRMWVGKAYHSHASSPLVLLMVISVAALLFVLSLLEALEIAYTILRDRHDDEFPENAKTLIAKMKGNKERLVYEAREWLATLIVVAITLMTEYDDGTTPFFVPLLLTTLPVLWFAQSLGKTCAKASPLRTLTSWPVRAVAWPFTRGMGGLIRYTGLDLPGQLLGNPLDQHLSKGQPQLRPSDEGFFLAGLQRYGLAIHDISVTIDLRKSGCRIRQRVVWFLLRYTGENFSRALYLEGKVKVNRLPDIRAFTCPTLRATYLEVGRLLDAVGKILGPVGNHLEPVGDKTATSGLKGIDGAEEVKEVDNACEPLLDGTIEKGKFTEVRFTAQTRKAYPLEPDKEAFALFVEHECEWDENAFKTKHGELDSFEMTFEYPCRRYELKILPEPGILLNKITPTAEFMSKEHESEQQRLKAAYRKTLHNEVDGILYSALDYALPGAKYKYSWVIGTDARRDTAPLPPGPPVDSSASPKRGASLSFYSTTPAGHGH